MVEPHLFCGPEFTLEVPSELPLPVEPNILLQLQSELYNLLTPLVRHKLHATWGTGTGSCDGTVPPPPCELCFVEVVESSPVSDPGARENEKDNVSNEKNEATVKLILRIKDSRAASELFVIGLRNPFITLPHGIHLHNRCGGSAVGTAKARATPVEILRKKELLRSRMNFDEDLWELLQGSLTSEWLLALEETYKQHKQQQSSNHEAVTSLRESQRHERRVESLLHYCEQNVLYIGVMDEEGKATPFLLAIGAFYKLGLTRHDALVHFARHHRRTIRALALFIARYTTAPEELEPFFTPSLTDEVVVACAEDQQVTCSMRQLAEDLLLHDEVCEAWPPTLHPFWIEHTVRPMMLRVEADRKRREELFQERESGVATEKEQGNRTGSGSSAPGGSGRGVGVFGFCNIMELHAYVREKQRVLVPQRVLSMLSKPRGGDSGDRDYADDGDDDDDDFLIKVRVEGDGDAEQNALHHQNKRGIDTKQPKQGQQQLSVRQGDSRKRRRQGTTTARSLAVTGAYRTILTLLGRTEPFDPDCEHFLQF